MAEPQKLEIELVVGAETDRAWIIGLWPTDKDKAVATDPAQLIFIVATKLGIDVKLDRCYELVGLGRRAAVAATKAKAKAE